MPNFIEITLDENTKIYLETAKDDIKKGDGSLFIPAASDGQILEKTKKYLDDTLNQIKVFSNKIADSIKSLDITPDEFEVDFAVKFSAEAGIIISSVSSEASITIKLKWTKS